MTSFRFDQPPRCVPAASGTTNFNWGGQSQLSFGGLPCLFGEAKSLEEALATYVVYLACLFTYR